MYSALLLSSFFRKMKRQLLYLLPLCCLSLFSSSVFAVDEINIIDSQFALHGYDPVSYFSGQPVSGNEEIFSVNDQVKYLFSSDKNKQLFDRDPERYIPMYGGYCAYGVRMGKKLNVDPLAYEVRDDHLYVMLNRATYKIWQQDITENIRISDQLWPKIKTKPVKSLQ